MTSVVPELSYHILIRIIGRLTPAQVSPRDTTFQRNVTGFLMDKITLNAKTAFGGRLSTVNTTNGHYMVTHALRIRTITVVEYTETVKECCTSNKHTTENLNVKFKLIVIDTTLDRKRCLKFFFSYLEIRMENE